LLEGRWYLERGGDGPERGRSGPSSEADIGSRAAGTLERGGNWVRGREPLMDGPERLLGRGTPWVTCVLCPFLTCGVFTSSLHFGRVIFPLTKGTHMTVPDTVQRDAPPLRRCRERPSSCAALPFLGGLLASCSTVVRPPPL
jgi:hypothetical protein